MINLAEYRRHSNGLADFLPWAALVGKGLILNKDGSFQHARGFADLTWTPRPPPNLLRLPAG